MYKRQGRVCRHRPIDEGGNVLGRAAFLGSHLRESEKRLHALGILGEHRFEALLGVGGLFLDDIQIGQVGRCRIERRIHGQSFLETRPRASQVVLAEQCRAAQVMHQRVIGLLLCLLYTSRCV